MKIHHNIWHILLGLGLIALVIACFLLFILLIFIGYNILFSFIMPISLIALYISLWILFSLDAEDRRLIKGIATLCACILGLGMTYVAIKEWRNARYRAVAAVKELELREYEPFYSDKLAVLEHPADLQLKDNLPVLDGSTALYPLYAAFVQTVYPPQLAKEYRELNRLIQSSKTGTAYQRLLDGEVDIIFVPAPSKSHQALADSKGLQFQLYPIGQEAFVFFVHQSNPVNNLSIAQIQQIYAGNIKNWQEVGGNKEAIRAFQRPENSGSQTALQRIMGDIALMKAPKEDIPTGMDGIISQVADYRNFPNAIGFSFLLYSSQLVQEKQIKRLSINNIAPNHENIRNKSYPFTYDFYAVTLGNESRETQQLIQWIQSPQGKELIEKTGYVPVP